jgi:dipeptidyl aminopeptidase/acylaminoacyl peptidase
MRAGLGAVFCLTITSLLPSASSAPAKRGITEKDLFDFVWIGDPQLSPDGTRVAYVRVTVNEKKEGYDTAIWTVPSAGKEEPRQLTSGPRDSSPRWSPDGQWLVFTRSVEKEVKNSRRSFASSR